MSSVLEVRRPLRLDEDCIGNFLTSYSVRGKVAELAAADPASLVERCRAAKRAMTSARCVEQLHRVEHNRTTPLLHPPGAHHFTVTNWSSFAHDELALGRTAPLVARPYRDIESAFARNVLGPRTAYVYRRAGRTCAGVQLPAGPQGRKLLDGLAGVRALPPGGD